jgi:hypothetical protein
MFAYARVPGSAFISSVNRSTMLPTVPPFTGYSRHRPPSSRSLMQAKLLELVANFSNLSIARFLHFSLVPLQPLRNDL